MCPSECWILGFNIFNIIKEINQLREIWDRNKGTVVSVLDHGAEILYGVRMDANGEDNDVREIDPAEIRLVLQTNRKLALLNNMIHDMSPPGEVCTAEREKYQADLRAVLMRHSFVSKLDYARFETGCTVLRPGQKTSGNLYLIAAGTAKVFTKTTTENTTDQGRSHTSHRLTQVKPVITTGDWFGDDAMALDDEDVQGKSKYIQNGKWIARVVATDLVQALVLKEDALIYELTGAEVEGLRQLLMDNRQQRKYEKRRVIIEAAEEAKTANVLPLGWEEKVAPDGRHFFMDYATKVRKGQHCNRASFAPRLSLTEWFVPRSENNVGRPAKAAGASMAD